LGHANQLNSTPFLRDDLLRERSHKARLILRRLEKEANLFAESLLLPSTFFTVYIDCIRKKVGIEDRGHGYIFVDDQPCNYIPYNELMDNVSNFFEVSKQAIEYKLRRLNKLSDCRNSAEAKLSDLTQLFPNKTPANQTADGG
jgi:Zn-dependent peptidase ImmA (M78 family)